VTSSPTTDARRLDGALVLATRFLVGVAAIVLVLATAADALGAKPRRGRIYDAVAGHQNPANGTGQSFFALKVSPRGRRVTVPPGEWDLPCTAGPSKGTDLAPSTVATTVALKANGSFVASLEQVDLNSGQPIADSPIVVRGRFVTTLRATGTISFKGTAGDDTSCNARVAWGSTLRPLNDHFVGKTGTGARVTFDRTVERHPLVWNFSVGNVPATCGANGNSVLTVVDAYLGRVRKGKFHAATEDANAEAVTINGTFPTFGSASGNASETDRGGCSFTAIRWTAKRTGRGVASSP
jgi:hypothetical protein